MKVHSAKADHGVLPDMVASRACVSPRRWPDLPTSLVPYQAPRGVLTPTPARRRACRSDPARCSDGRLDQDPKHCHPCLSLPVICADLRPATTADAGSGPWRRRALRKEHPVADSSDMTTPPSRRRGGRRPTPAGRSTARSQPARDRGNRSAPAAREGPDPDRRHPRHLLAGPRVRRGPVPSDEVYPDRLMSVLTCPQTYVSATGFTPPPPRPLSVFRTRVRNQRRTITGVRGL